MEAIRTNYNHQHHEICPTGEIPAQAPNPWSTLPSWKRPGPRNWPPSLDECAAKTPVYNKVSLKKKEKLHETTTPSYPPASFCFVVKQWEVKLKLRTVFGKITLELVKGEN